MKASSSSEEAPGPQSPFSRLPPELREKIYSHLLHKGHNEPCNKFLLGLGNAGCFCGEGLSLADRFFYEELRPRTFKCMKFIFNNPESAELFLRNLGPKTEWVTSLKITYKNTLVDSCLLLDAFGYFSRSNLCDLELTVLPYGGPLNTTSRPIYLPSASNAAEFSATAYDLLLRPLKYSLNSIQSIQILTVVWASESRRGRGNLQIQHKHGRASGSRRENHRENREEEFGKRVVL